MGNPISTLVSTVDRNVISVDGKEYAIRQMDELSLVESRKLARIGKLAREFSTDPETVDLERMSEELKDVFLMLVVDSGAICGKLSDLQRLKVVTSFLSQGRETDDPAKRTETGETFSSLQG